MSLPDRTQRQTPNPASILSDFETTCRAAGVEPFLDEKSMDENIIACTWSNFRRPRLGRFKRLEDVDFIELLSHGQDGIAWKVGIDGYTYALKVFWDNHPPQGAQHWAMQRECQTASLLEKMRFVIERASDPVWLNPEPRTFCDAALNLHAFSDEGRSRQLFRETPGAVRCSTAPHLRRCYGWTPICGGELCALPSTLSPPGATSGGHVRELSPSEQYHAIVYQYVPSSDVSPDIDAVQAQLDFLWRGGWCVPSLWPENLGSTADLLDMGDAICPWHAAWDSRRYKRRDAREMVVPRREAPHSYLMS
ncbi:hypothetical protein AK830_g12299 [Neonectria ditissima]|uniref:Uncharacterized protein n=1 Tax=Neonectria ditissima TaxID=78410 RepID=A0A0N8H4T5_9HYPO|nr:hypothetical protein AK830_g12299 [Neonectria ditissima]